MEKSEEYVVMSDKRHTRMGKYYQSMLEYCGMLLNAYHVSGTILSQGLADISTKGQIISILGFVSHIVSVRSNHLSP